MEAKEKSNCAHNAQLQAQLLTTYGCHIDHFEFPSQCAFHREGYDAVLFLMMLCPTASRNDRCAHGRDSLIPPPSVSRLKKTTKECNAQLQQILELQKAVNVGEDKNAELRRELEEKTVELANEVSCWVVYHVVTNAS